MLSKEKEIQSAQRMVDESNQEIAESLEKIQSLNMVLGASIARRELAMKELKSLKRGSL